MSAHYEVEQTTALVGEGFDIDEWVTVAAWKVTRIEGNMGWHVAKYRDKKTADAVAGILGALVDKEV